jgi:hypothetical protein
LCLVYLLIVLQDKGFAIGAKLARR